MPEERPERIVVDTASRRVFVDVLWIPVSKLIDPVVAATYKILPHLLLESEALWTRSESVGPLVEEIRRRAYEREVWERRMGHQIDFGDAALQEASKNLSFPPAAAFFLQMAHAYYTMALADSLRRSTMALVTRPMASLRRISAETGCELEKLLVSNLRLQAEPETPVRTLDRIFDAVSRRCAPRRPSGVSGRAMGHYEYSLSPLEFEYRRTVTEALAGRGDTPSANFYARFWAYSLARCPIVLEDARRGRNPSFYVPYGPLKDSIEAACPEILSDVELVMGGPRTGQEVQESVAGTSEFRNLAVDQILRSGLRPSSKRAPSGGVDL